MRAAVEVLPLVRGLVLPEPAPAGTRAHVPAGYGVQEQCLPFTAATSLGFLVGAPFAFGLCAPADVPAGAHAFRAPVEDPGVADDRVFYVIDDPRCRFAGNAFAVDASPVLPGLGFFHRPDQAALFKVHLPYIWRTPPEVDLLFLGALNRSGPDVLAGLVESDWYASPVNLVVRRPALGEALHVAAGDPIAQVVVVSRSQRRPELTVLAPHARHARELRAELGEWHRRHAADRSVYKRLARERRRSL